MSVWILDQLEESWSVEEKFSLPTVVSELLLCLSLGSSIITWLTYGSFCLSFYSLYAFPSYLGMLSHALYIHGLYCIHLFVIQFGQGLRCILTPSDCLTNYLQICIYYGLPFVLWKLRRLSRKYVNSFWGTDMTYLNRYLRFVSCLSSYVDWYLEQRVKLNPNR